WTALGIVTFPLGVTLASVAMRQPEVARVLPIAAGAVLLVAGAFQHTPWKTRHLAFCRAAPGRDHALPADAGAAWRYGRRPGFHCSHSCAGLTAVVLGLGVMDLRVMAAVSAAITAEHLAPSGVRVARAIGVVVVAAGLCLIARAAGLG